jgi:hypothetical protein
MRPIDRLDYTVKDLASFIASLAPEKLVPSTKQQWGAREVFSHIVFWHEEYARITQERLSHQEPQILPGTHIEINALAVEQYRELPVDALIDKLLTAQAGLLQMYEQAKDLRIAFKQHGAVLPFSEMIDGTERHIRSHLERLKKRYH